MAGVCNFFDSPGCITHSRTCQGAGGQLPPKSQTFKQTQNFSGSDKKNSGRSRFRAETKNYLGKTIFLCIKN